MKKKEKSFSWIKDKCRQVDQELIVSQPSAGSVPIVRLLHYCKFQKCNFSIWWLNLYIETVKPKVGMELRLRILQFPFCKCSVHCHTLCSATFLEMVSDRNGAVSWYFGSKIFDAKGPIWHDIIQCLFEKRNISFHKFERRMVINSNSLFRPG